MRRALGAFLSLVVASLCACNAFNSYVSVENRSQSALSEARWVFAESPELVVTLGTIASGDTASIKVPPGIGETSATFTAQRGSETISANCGYLESDGHYQARIVVLANGTPQCDIRLEMF